MLPGVTPDDYVDAADKLDGEIAETAELGTPNPLPISSLAGREQNTEEEGVGVDCRASWMVSSNSLSSS